MNQNNRDEQLIASLLQTIKVQGELIDMLRKDIQNLEAEKASRISLVNGTNTFEYRGTIPLINTTPFTAPVWPFVPPIGPTGASGREQLSTPFISTQPLPYGSIQFSTAGASSANTCDTPLSYEYLKSLAPKSDNDAQG
jgi:hypothetical protein